MATFTSVMFLDTVAGVSYEIDRVTGRLGELYGYRLVRRYLGKPRCEAQITGLFEHVDGARHLGNIIITELQDAIREGRVKL